MSVFLRRNKPEKMWGDHHVTIHLDIASGLFSLRHRARVACETVKNNMVTKMRHELVICELSQVGLDVTKGNQKCWFHFHIWLK